MLCGSPKSWRISRKGILGSEPVIGRFQLKDIPPHCVQQNLGEFSVREILGSEPVIGLFQPKNMLTQPLIALKICPRKILL